MKELFCERNWERKDLMTQGENSVQEEILKRKMGLIENVRKLFMGTPAIF